MSDICSLFPLFGDPWPSCLLPSQFLIVKAMFFLVVMYGCKSWSIKKVEHQRTDGFKLWCQTRLRVPSAARRPNQSIQKEINPEYSEEGRLLRLKLQYFGHLLRRADSLEKTRMLGNIEGKRRKGRTEDETGWWHHWLKGHELEQVMEDGDGQGSLVYCSPWSHRVRHDWVT